MICRFCHRSMGQKILNGQTLDICTACGATWIDQHELGALLKSPKDPVPAEQIEALKQDLAWSSSHDATPSRMCPKCGNAMPRHLFAALSGIALDFCARDGIWCDPGELDRLVEFLERGGLQLARLKKWEDAIPVQQKSKEPLPRVMQLLNRAAALFS